MRKDYTNYWCLPPRLPPGYAYYQGLFGAVAVIIMILLLIGVTCAPTHADDDWTLRPAEHLMWKRTLRADTASGYREYLDLYGKDGEHVAEALARWVELTHRGDFKALQLPPKRRWNQT